MSAEVLDLVEAIAAACREVDGTDPIDEFGWMTLRNHPEQVSSVLGEDGFALAYQGQMTVAVTPQARRSGVGAALVATLLEDVEPPLEAWSHGQHPGAVRLAERFAFTAVRSLWVMRRSLAADLPALAPAAGVTVRRWRDTDAGDLLAINAAAFAHHPEQGAMDAANLADRMAESWFDAADLLIAEDAETGVMLGFHWTKRHSATEGEVYVVGVAPHAQGRGLGKILTLAGLQHLAATGITDVHLYVESDNAPAVAVYTGLDFTHAPADTHTMYRREA